MDVSRSIKIQGGLSGHAVFQVIDRATGRVEHEHEQHNLILDSGLEAFGVASANGAGGLTGYPDYGLWRSYFCVGTGSVAPAVTQSVLAAQVAGSSSTGGFSAEQSSVYSYDSVAGVYKCVSTIVRTIDFVGAYNLTEWGLARQSTGSLSIRELFRDGSNNPVAIAVAAGKQLKITHVLTITLPATLGAISFSVTGLGTISGQGGIWASSSGIAAMFANLYAPAAGTFFCHMSSLALPAAGQAGAWFTSSGSGKNMTTDSYVGNGRKWTKRIAISTSEFVGNIHLLVFGMYTNSQAAISGGYIIRLDNPISKTASNTMSLALDVSFNRSAS